MAAGSVGRGHSRLRQSTGRPAQWHRSMRQSNGSHARVRQRQVYAPRPRTAALRCPPMSERRGVRQSTHRRRVPARHKCASRRLRGRQTPRQQPVRRNPCRRRDGNEGILRPCSQFSPCSRLRCSRRTPSPRKTPASRAARSQRARASQAKPHPSHTQAMAKGAYRGHRRQRSSVPGSDVRVEYHRPVKRLRAQSSALEEPSPHETKGRLSV